MISRKRISVYWVNLNKHNKQLGLSILSIFVGLITGVAVVLLKNTTGYIEKSVEKIEELTHLEFIYFIFPVVGIGLTFLVIRYIIRKHVGHDGIPRILYAITRNEGFVEAHHIFSSAITSALTVGFGGSAGLEGPVVTTGGAIGSNVGRCFFMSYKQRILLIGSATAAAISAIFEAPIAGIVFALEVMMVDLTTTSLIPLALASISGSLTSIFLTGKNVLYNYPVNEEKIDITHLLYYILLGAVTGILAVYFSKIFDQVVAFFRKFQKRTLKFLVGSLILGLLIFIFPVLYGEGYSVINQALNGDYSFLFTHLFINHFFHNTYIIIVLLVIIAVLKIFATALTFEAGGIGGIFAPTMFIGAMFGLALSLLAQTFGIEINPANSILVGMAALMASVMQAPLTGIFLISEITQGYNLMLPLMISAIVSFLTVRLFQTNSIYTKQLADRGHLLTHHADKNALTLMDVRKLLETNFKIVRPNDKLRQIIRLVAQSERNVFPVVDENGKFLGIITLDNIRKIMFEPDLYDTIIAKELMFVPEVVVHDTDGMEEIAEKIQKSGKFNVAVLDKDGKYLGFVSRANVFSTYRNLLREFSTV